LVDAALAGATMARVRAARSVHREQPFALALPGPGAPLVNGIVDLLAIEDDGGALVVDYKTDHIGDADPEAVVASGYAIQRTIYALAALRSGAPRVEVVHLFLERPAEPAVARYDRADAGALEAQVAARAAGLVERRFPVAETPHRELCATCPGRGGLCSWPEERVLRPLADAGAPR
ncbi:MAG TPA: PD-(D/E)XK nuclease family protein, partial [Solirubrobacteraceae bacterium]|nr:PD-(D/E)XK nuclease family protein [Solirubrobacteraceae bacterium]